MEILLTILSVAFYCLWRRWFGGGFKHTWLGNLRGVQCAVYLVITTLLAYYMSPLSVWWYSLIFAVVFSVYSYVQFWSRGHGQMFDIGRDTNPPVERYNNYWFHIPCDWLLPNHKYGFLYDFIYMGIRYTFPVVMLFVYGFSPELFGLDEVCFDWRIVLLGLWVSPVYAFCWTLFEREPWIFQKYKTISGPTNLAEYVVGGIWGLWFLCVL